MKTARIWTLLAATLLLMGCSDDDGADTNANNSSGNWNGNANGIRNANANANGNTNGNETPYCGDGTQDPGEECDDGADNSDTQPDACRESCHLAHCGDGVIDSAEGCDEGAANSDTTPDACRTTCQPATCGDGVLDTAESCDGSDVGQQSCGDVGSFNHGTLGCDSACTLDLTACYLCGDGVIDPGEVCDGGALGGADCPSAAGLADGTLACDAACSFDTSSCWECGNGTVEAAEVCDDGAGNCDDSATCQCATNCTLPGCGNGVVESYLGEQCDEGAANCDTAGCTCTTTCTAPGDPCGYPLDGVWFEIDYTGAFTATNPSWTYSNTPGWGEAEWAASGSSWPEVWDLYNNINVIDDVGVGDCAAVGPSGVLQIMLGLGDLTSYSSASVCVEGRSYSATSSVLFDVYNPLNNCGASGSMSHSWQVHATGLDLQSCLIPADDFQALRIDPTGGSSSLCVKRVTVILHDAVY